MVWSSYVLGSTIPQKESLVESHWIFIQCNFSFFDDICSRTPKLRIKLQHVYKSLSRPNKPQRWKPRTVEAITLEKTSNYPYKGVINPTKDFICWSLPERCGGDRLPTGPGYILRVPTHHTEIKAFLISNSRNHWQSLSLDGRVGLAVGLSYFSFHIHFLWNPFLTLVTQPSILKCHYIRLISKWVEQVILHSNHNTVD